MKLLKIELLLTNERESVFVCDSLEKNIEKKENRIFEKRKFLFVLKEIFLSEMLSLFNKFFINGALFDFPGVKSMDMLITKVTQINQILQNHLFSVKYV